MDKPVSLSSVEARLFESLLERPWGELPATLDEGFLVAEIARQEAQLEAVDTALTARVRESYGGFVQAMQQIRGLEQSACQSAVGAAAARGHLAGLQGQMVVPALLLVRSAQRLGKQRRLLEQCGQLAEARQRLAAARELLARQQFGECLALLAQVAAADKTCLAMRALAAEARAVREEVVTTLKSGEGYLGRLVGVEQWDEQRFLRYMEALQSAGDEFGSSGARVQVVHRTLLRNADRNIGGGAEMRVEEMKRHFDSCPSAAAYLESVRLCFLHVSVALRLQVCVSRAPMGRAEQLACASLRPKFWGELCRRVSAALASRAVFGLAPAELLVWHRLAAAVAELGRAYCGEEAAEQHARLQKSVAGVLLRYMRHRHSLALARLRAALCAEHWEHLALVPTPQRAAAAAAAASAPLYDPAVHSVTLPATVAWRSPFLDALEAGGAAEAGGGGGDAAEEEEEAALRGSHVEEGDELLFGPPRTPQPPHRQGSGAVGPAGGGGGGPEAGARLLACEAGRLAVAMAEEYALLVEALPDAAVLGVLRALQSLWRYFVISVWSFFVDAGAAPSVSEGLQRLQQQARALLAGANGGGGGGSGGAAAAVGGELLELFGAGEQSGGAVVTLRKRDETDVDYIVQAAQLSPACDLAGPAAVWGMQARFVAAESVWSVSAALQRTRLARLAAHPQSKRIEHFYESEVGLAGELRDILWERCTAGVVQAAELQRAVAAASWSEAEPSTQPPPYLADLTRRMRVFASQLKKEGAASGPAAASLWSYFVAAAMSALLAGFAAVKRCDDAGRAQMLAQLNQFAAEVAKLTALRPLPLLERTRAYLNAYFEKEAVMSNFIEQCHYQYEEAHLVALLNVAAPKMSRKDRAAALQKIKDWKS